MTHQITLVSCYCQSKTSQEDITHTTVAYIINLHTKYMVPFSIKQWLKLLYQDLNYIPLLIWTKKLINMNFIFTHLQIYSFIAWNGVSERIESALRYFNLYFLFYVFLTLNYQG